MSELDKHGDTVPSDEFLKECYPEVEEFAKQMRRELWSNRAKGDREGWLQMGLRECWGEIQWHSAKLAVAIKYGDADKIREYAADVANMAMMLDDILMTRTLLEREPPK